MFVTCVPFLSQILTLHVKIQKKYVSIEPHICCELMALADEVRHFT